MLSDEALHVTGGRPGLSSWKRLFCQLAEPWASLLCNLSRASIAAAQGQACNNCYINNRESVWLCWWSLPLRLQNIAAGWGIRGNFIATHVFPLQKTDTGPASRKMWGDTSPQDPSANIPLLAFLVVTKGSPSKQRGGMETTSKPHFWHHPFQAVWLQLCDSLF